MCGVSAADHGRGAVVHGRRSSLARRNLLVRGSSAAAKCLLGNLFASGLPSLPHNLAVAGVSYDRTPLHARLIRSVPDRQADCPIRLFHYSVAACCTSQGLDVPTCFRWNIVVHNLILLDTAMVKRFAG
jgi:hypothetical protein